jgi:hypothetical protein
VKDLAYRVVPVVAALPAPSAILAGATARLSTDGHLYWFDGATWVDVNSDARLTTVKLTADVTNNSATLANVTGLAVSLAAFETYAISAQVLFQSAATNNGIRLTQTVPTGATVVAQWNTPTSLTATTNANQRGSDAGAATSGIDLANSSTLALGNLLVVMGATAGLLQIRFGSRNANVVVAVKAGSNLVAIKVG